MTVSVRDARSSPADKRWIESIYRDYLDDLTPLNTGVFPILGEVGHSEPDQLTRWFADSSANLLLILKSNEPAGFAMVGRGGPSFGRPAVDFRMAEFFIARPYRRLGVGRLVARLGQYGHFQGLSGQTGRIVQPCLDIRSSRRRPAGHQQASGRADCRRVGSRRRQHCYRPDRVRPYFRKYRRFREYPERRGQ